jgi:NTP pyrophosphatase (non-canonical NTP hydrolase)
MMDLNDLTQRIHKWSVEKGWWPRPTGTLKAKLNDLRMLIVAEDRNLQRTVMINKEFQEVVLEIERLDAELKRLKFFEKCALMNTEITEALEEVRNGRGYRETYKSLAKAEVDDPMVTSKPEGVPIELADLLIRLLDLCGEYNIDLEEAVNAKLIYNDSRPFRHGNKTA